MTRQKTVDNYLALLMALSARKQRINSVSKQLSKFRVSRGAGKQLREMGLIEELPTGGFKWIGGKPTEDVAREMVTRINAEVLNSINNSKGHRENPGRQQHNLAGMTIHSVPTSLIQKLRKERDEHADRITKIDAVLTAAEELA